MPGPGLLRPASGQVDVADGPAVCQHPVIVFEITGSKAVRAGHRAVVGVMKEEDIVRVALMMRPNAAHEFWLVPFMHKHQVNAVQEAIESQFCQGIRRAAQVRVHLAEGAQWCCPMLGHEIDYAPGCPGFKNADLVAQRLRRHPTLLADSGYLRGPERILLIQLPRPSARMVRNALAAQKSPHGPATQPTRLGPAARAAAYCGSAPCAPADPAPLPPQRLARTVATPRWQAPR